MTLSATQRIKEIIQEEQQEVEGTLKIGIIPTLAPYIVTGFHRALYPQISGSKSRGRRIGLRRDHSPAET